MKKSTLTILAALCAGATFATEYHWRGNAPDMTDAGKSGAWTTVSNWTDKDGNAVTDYPHNADDIAVFHGMAMGGYAEIKDTDIISLAELRFEEGNSLLYCGLSANVTVTKLTIKDAASFEFVSNDTTPHWDTDDFAVPSNFTVGNRSELLSDGAIYIRNAISHRNLNNYFDRRGYLMIGDDGKLTPINAPNQNGDVGVGSDTVKDVTDGLAIGGWEQYRGVGFEHWGHMTQPANYTLPSGYVVALNFHTYIGKYSNDWLGLFSTQGAPLCFWGYATLTGTAECYIRAPISASAVVQPANAVTVIYDDHASDEVPLYRAIAGGIRLGGAVKVSDTDTYDTTCKMNAATFEIGWNATLDVACANAMNADSTINVSSYNKKGGVFGKINLANNATVNKLYIDGVEQDAGTYGSSSSSADNKNNDIFTGSGVLTVTNGTYVPPVDPPVTEKEPMIIYFN